MDSKWATIGNYYAHCRVSSSKFWTSSTQVIVGAIAQDLFNNLRMPDLKQI